MRIEKSGHKIYIFENFVIMYLKFVKCVKRSKKNGEKQ